MFSVGPIKNLRYFIEHLEKRTNFFKSVESLKS